MNITLPTGKGEDDQACRLIRYKAFKAIADQYNFPPDFPVPDITIGLMSFLLSGNNIYSVVAERDGRIIGSNFLSKNGIIAEVGPITVDPDLHNASVGRLLMENVMQRSKERRFAGIRLVQAAYIIVRFLFKFEKLQIKIFYSRCHTYRAGRV